LTSTQATAPPSAANRSAVARPIPDVAPLTSRRRPSKRAPVIASFVVAGKEGPQGLGARRVELRQRGYSVTGQNICEPLVGADHRQPVAVPGELLRLLGDLLGDLLEQRSDDLFGIVGPRELDDSPILLCQHSERVESAGRRVQELRCDQRDPEATLIALHSFPQERGERGALCRWIVIGKLMRNMRVNRKPRPL
jgi:hypothetical protein